MTTYSLTLESACAKYHIEQKLLLGRMLRNDYDDPAFASRKDQPVLVLDDWRLQQLFKS